jgi:flagellar hook assembly protein FlgD
MKFAQIIEFRTSRIEDFNVNLDAWMTRTEGKRIPHRAVLGRDRDVEDHYLLTVEFSSHEQGMANSNIINMVGQVATVKGSLITTDGSGIGAPVAFTLDRASAQTVVQIQDASGNVVRTLDMGGRPGGITKVTWDGRNDNGTVQPAGTYAVAVKATDKDGGTVQVSQETSATVQGVAFDKGYPVLQLSNGVSAPVSDLLRVESPPKTP